MKLHRAITLVVMMMVSLLLIGFMTLQGIQEWSSRSLLALGIVIAAAAVGGIAFSWRRYFGR